ncbi:MAG: hypothetical protein Q4D62_14155, partial [Planctomycetia bacterium]|nr:hypothetical protein [Planctomycetia bacterium]
WFRILERDKVRGSENEIPDAPIWARTMKAFEHYFSDQTPPSPPERTPDDLRQTPKIQRVPQVDRLVKQAAGLLSAAASCVCEKFTYIEEVWEKSAALLKFYAEPMYGDTAADKVFYAQLEQKRERDPICVFIDVTPRKIYGYKNIKLPNMPAKR